MKSGSTCSGRTIAGVLAGAWRASPPAVDISVEKLEQAVPRLLQTGAGALAWRQLRGSKVSPGSIAALRAAYIGNAVHAAQHERDLIFVLKTFQAFQLDPILIKGWAAARPYGEPGLRPSGDIDLVVPSHQLKTAEALLKTQPLASYHIDLKHDEASKFGAASFEAMHARSVTSVVGDTPVRLLGPEDNLRVLALHLVKHGAWRPLWLCDVSAALEQLPPRFDWEICLGPDTRYRRWIECVVNLAQNLLTAKGDHAPWLELPRWLAPAVLKQWGQAYDSKPPLMREQVRGASATDAWRLLAGRWRNPVQATVDADAAFDNWPRWPYQLKDYAVRAGKFVPRVFRRA
jgi:hypothetical protein